MSEILCAKCGKPIVGLVRCPIRGNGMVSMDELIHGRAICDKHCFKCKYFDTRISVVRCTYPKKAKNEKS